MLKKIRAGNIQAFLRHFHLRYFNLSAFKGYKLRNFHSILKSKRKKKPEYLPGRSYFQEIKPILPGCKSKIYYKKCLHYYSLWTSSAKHKHDFDVKFVLSLYAQENILKSTINKNNN